MKKTLLAVALTAASMTAIADVSLSGHVNYAMGAIEDFTGVEDIDVKTGSSSQSRLIFKSSTEVNGIEFGTNITLGMNSGGSGDLDKRQNEVYVGGSFGRLTLGQGQQAGDGFGELEYAGTYNTVGSYGSWGLGGVNAALGENNQGGPGRKERLKYDAPALGDLHISVSVADSDNAGNDVGVGVQYKLDSVKFGINSYTNEAADTDHFGASVAFKTGAFNAALQYAEAETTTANVDKEQVRVILGYKTGAFAFSVDHQLTEQGVSANDANTTGLSVAYNAAKGVQLYAGYRDAEALDGDVDGDGVLMGAKIKF